MSKVQSGKKIGEDSSNGNFLHEIEVISKALYLNKTHPMTLIRLLSSQSKSIGKIQLPKPKSKLKDGNEDPPHKEKKSIWSWRALKAFTHVPNKRFNCFFSLQVHSMEGLPPNLKDLSLCVHWKRRDVGLMTRSARVSEGNAEFQEKLTYTCSVYGSRNGPHRSAKYEAKHFLLYVSIVGNPELDLGKHRIDLTRLLPLTLEELEEENCSGKWTTSFRLSGKAKEYGQNGDWRKLRRAESLPSRSHTLSRSSEDIKDLHEVLPARSELYDSVNMLHLKHEEEYLKPSMDYKLELDVFSDHIELVKPNAYSFDTAKENVESEWEVNEVSAIENVNELSSKEEVKSEEGTLNHLEIKSAVGVALEEDNELISLVKEFDSNPKEDDFCNKLNYKDVYESVASDFLDMLEIEHSPFGLGSESEPESPREQLLRQFEKDTMANGHSLFNFDFDEDPTEFDYDQTQAFVEIPKIGTEAIRSKMKDSTLENSETEASMRSAFEHSASKTSLGSGLESHLELPPLGEGLGPFVQTTTGGFLRSMNPKLFSDAKSAGSLIMQASSPVVVPAEMGSSIMEILQCLASVGIEKLSMQANKLMPLEDIQGKTIQQFAWEAAPSLEAHKRHDLLQHGLDIGQSTSAGQKRIKRKAPGPGPSKFESSSTSNDIESDFVSLKDLVPLAMDKIEALSIEGLRIQSCLSNIGGSLGLKGVGGLQLVDVKDCGDDVDGLMGLSLTLDERMRLDSGEIDVRDEISERTSKILAAHHASDSGKFQYGLLGNNFTVTLMVQMRGPLRNYEPVGAPMLALIQVERVFVPPKLKIYNTVSETMISNKDEDKCDPAKNEIKEEAKQEKSNEEEVIPQFKITDVHVAGFKNETGKKKLLGSKTQQQCGSHWLLANGMGKNNKVSGGGFADNLRILERVGIFSNWFNSCKRWGLTD
ncbi:hypothetical protein LguiA_005282 [Lonicera macranthoides]